jgi:hypothetical protein
VVSTYAASTRYWRYILSAYTWYLCLFSLPAQAVTQLSVQVSGVLFLSYLKVFVLNLIENISGNKTIQVSGTFLTALPM